MPLSFSKPSLVRVNPPIFEAQYHDKRVTIHLDSSAVLKLRGSVSQDRMSEVLTSRRDTVADAARRVIDLRQGQTGSHEIVVTLSALDLD